MGKGRSPTVWKSMLRTLVGGLVGLQRLEWVVGRSRLVGDGFASGSGDGVDEGYFCKR